VGEFDVLNSRQNATTLGVLKKHVFVSFWKNSPRSVLSHNAAILLGYFWGLTLYFAKQFATFFHFMHIHKIVFHTLLIFIVNHVTKLV
jgi:hypothetical protein